MQEANLRSQHVKDNDTEDSSFAKTGMIKVLTGEKMTYLTNMDESYYVMGPRDICMYSIAWKSSQPRPLSMALPKKSPYFELFRHFTLQVIL